MKVNSLTIVIISIIVIFGGVFISDSMGLWQTESSKEPMKFSSGTFEGQPNPDDIRGSFSFGDIENAFGVDASLIADAFGIQTNDPASVKAKDIEEIYSDIGEDIEIGTGSVKKFISLYTGLPYESDDFLPSSAIEVLKSSIKWNDEMLPSLEAYIIDMTIDLSFEDADKEDVQKDDNTETEHTDEIGIKGQTTVADAIAYGISLDEIEEVLGIKIDKENMLIRDLCDQNGLSFGTIKDALNEKLDN